MSALSQAPSGLAASGGAAETTTASARRITYRTRGQQHGPITRLMSPSDLGEWLKPFVFLDLFDIKPESPLGFGWHPHSGIATLTVLLQGGMRYEDTAGDAGVLREGGAEWMRAGGGVWHTGGPADTERVRGFQLWVALPPELESGPAQTRYLAPEDIQQDGPVRVILGHHGTAGSKIPAPSPMNYLSVRLRAGERWRYQPPPGHTIGWAAVSLGKLHAPERLQPGEMAIFEESEAAIDFHAETDTEFVLGSGVKHAHELVLGSYSVHTHRAALQQGESRIQQIGQQLRAEGRMR